AGNRRWKVAPLPTPSLVAWILPPMAMTLLAHQCSPIPPFFCCFVLKPRWNSEAMASSEMPPPLSRTSMCSMSLPSTVSRLPVTRAAVAGLGDLAVGAPGHADRFGGIDHEVADHLREGNAVAEDRRQAGQGRIDLHCDRRFRAAGDHGGALLRQLVEVDRLGL